MRRPAGTTLTGWRKRGHEIIFEADTRAGMAFDVSLIFAIIASTLVVMLDSVASIRASHSGLLRGAEWTFTILFTIEYALRLMCVARPIRYARSFFGVVDLLSILPTYLSLFLPGARYLTVIRTLRCLRIFRVLELATYLEEIESLTAAMKASRRKILVFVFGVIALVVVLGSVMYLVEGADNGFTSIPRSVYWAIVTLTTVGYGDISPRTDLGQAIAAGIMILGYGIIAVPTGIVTAELTHVGKAKPSSRRACESCSAEGHDLDAEFCKRCGEPL